MLEKNKVAAAVLNVSAVGEFYLKKGLVRVDLASFRGIWEAKITEIGVFDQKEKPAQPLNQLNSIQKTTS